MILEIILEQEGTTNTGHMTINCKSWKRIEFNAIDVDGVIITVTQKIIKITEEVKGD